MHLLHQGLSKGQVEVVTQLESATRISYSSLLYVGPMILGGALVEAASLYHTPWSPFIQGNKSSDLRVLLRAKRGDLRNAYIVFGDRYSDDMRGRATMTKIGSDDIYDYLSAPMKLGTGRYKYVFYLEGTDGSECWYSDSGMSNDIWNTRVFQMPHVAAIPAWDGPDWAQDAVCYQVFVDRFRNGNQANDPPGICDWRSQPNLCTRLGGDLDGVTDALPYLHDLGVTMLYLTPIFLAPSGHKYDTSDYYKIDPEFGDLASLRRLSAGAHSRGMRVILDGAFNHCGTDFFAFQSLVQDGANSPYRDWFYVDSFPITTNPPNYETFGSAIPNMPKLRLSHPEVRQYFVDVAAFWVREAGIDGWRLDVANEIDPLFVREMRTAIRAINPETYIVGEIWHSAEPWLRGDIYDGVTAYPWRDAGLAFFSGWRSDAAWMEGQLTKHFNSARVEGLRSSLNLLGSHDTPRYLELMGGDFGKARLLVAYQMTSPGIPQIYYGDEVGMRGWSDPECRRGMVWDPATRNNEMLGYYKYLIGLRQQHPALRRGEFRSLWNHPGDPFWAMLRLHKSGNVLVAFNSAWDERVVELPGGWLRAGESIQVKTLTGWSEATCTDAEKPGAHTARHKPVQLRLGPQTATLVYGKEGSAGL